MPHILLYSIRYGVAGLIGRNRRMPTVATRHGDESRNVPVHQFWQIGNILSAHGFAPDSVGFFSAATRIVAHGRGFSTRLSFQCREFSGAKGWTQITCAQHRMQGPIRQRFRKRPKWEYS